MRARSALHLVIVVAVALGLLGARPALVGAEPSTKVSMSNRTGPADLTPTVAQAPDGSRLVAAWINQLSSAPDLRRRAPVPRVDVPDPVHEPGLGERGP